jgi:ParB-like chromosome segregation protein Spo0J
MGRSCRIKTGLPVFFYKLKRQVLTLKIRIDQIIIGDRRRGDMGDISGLAESIREYGLLHPIVLDAKNNLVAGGRRLTACKSLGWKEIEFTPLGELTEKQLRAIELEENLRRKDLTEFEKSRELVNLSEVVKEIAKESKCTLGVHLQEKENKIVPGSYRDVSEKIGVPVSTIREAEQHVKAVETYPELEELPKKETIQTAKKLDVMPEPEREKVVQKIKETGKVPQEVKGNVDFMNEPGYLPPEERVKNDPGLNLSDMFYQVSKLVNVIKKNGGIQRILNEESQEDLLEFQSDFEYYHRVFNEWKIALDDEMKNRTQLRRVK